MNCTGRPSSSDPSSATLRFRSSISGPKYSKTLVCLPETLLYKLPINLNSRFNSMYARKWESEFTAAKIAGRHLSLSPL